jgi:hypothetical protein
VGGLGEGRHRLSVQATDSAGNVDPTPAARTLVVDQAAPPAPCSATTSRPAACPAGR